MSQNQSGAGPCSETVRPPEKRSKAALLLPHKIALLTAIAMETARTHLHLRSLGEEKKVVSNKIIASAEQILTQREMQVNRQSPPGKCFAVSVQERCNAKVCICIKTVIQKHRFV